MRLFSELIAENPINYQSRLFTEAKHEPLLFLEQKSEYSMEIAARY